MANNHYEGQCGRCFGDERADGSCEYCEIFDGFELSENHHSRIARAEFKVNEAGFAMRVTVTQRRSRANVRWDQATAAVSFDAPLVSLSPARLGQYLSLIQKAGRIAETWNAEVMESATA